jgi:pimeloyl-ACP methyl ester carboxylesterase
MLISILVITALAALPLLAVTAAAYAIDRGHRGDAGTEPLNFAGSLWAFLHEWLAGVALLAAWPFRLRGKPSTDARRVAVLVPEMHCSSASYWYLQRRLRAAGWSAIAGVHRTGHVAQTNEALDAQLALLPAGAELVLVGHGVGGLLVRDYAERRPDLHIRHVVTLGAPHQGSRAVPYRWFRAPTLPPAPSEPRVDVIALYSDFDAWLVPIDDAYCPRGFNIAVRGVGHCAMLQSRRVADLIVENLAAPAPTR